MLVFVIINERNQKIWRDEWFVRQDEVALKKCWVGGWHCGFAKPVMLASHVDTGLDPVCPFLIHIPAHGLGKAVEDGPSTSSPVTHMEDLETWGKLLAFGLCHHNPGHCDNLGSKPVNRESLYLFLFL